MSLLCGQGYASENNESIQNLSAAIQNDDLLEIGTPYVPVGIEPGEVAAIAPTPANQDCPILWQVRYCLLEHMCTIFILSEWQKILGGFLYGL